MVLVGVSIIVVWGVLLGAAVLCRLVGRMRRGPSIAVVTCCYLALGALALLWLGWTWRGGAGVTGMLLPYTVAVGTVFLMPART